MKKTLILSALMFIYLNMTSQNLYDVNKIQSPTYNELAKYVDYPVTHSTGLPNISYDIVNLPTKVNDLDLNVTMSYHPNSISYRESGTELGLGWNLMGLGNISKSVNGIVDDFHDFVNPGSNVPYPQLYDFKYDDIYYYNFFGYSGKFAFSFKDSDNTFSIVDLSENNLKFSFVQSSTNHLKVESFVVTDTRGYKFHFEVKDVELHNYKLYNPFGPTNLIPMENPITGAFSYPRCYTILGVNGGQVICEDNPLFQQIVNTSAYTTNFHGINVDYYSNFLISKVTDKNNVILYQYTYNQIQKNTPPNEDNLWYLNTNRIIHKLNQIHSPGIGKLTFSYECSLPLRKTLNDICALKGLSKFDHRDNLIKEVVFDNILTNTDEIFLINPFYGSALPSGHLYYSTFKISERRQLNKLIFKGNNQQIEREYGFFYNDVAHFPNTIFKLDMFGFLDIRNSLCEINGTDYEGITNPATCTSGVLNRIKMPTGDDIVFEFESNTFHVNKCQRNVDFSEPRLGPASIFENNFIYSSEPFAFNEAEMNEIEGEYICNEDEQVLGFYRKYNPENTTYTSVLNLPFNLGIGGEQIINFNAATEGYYLISLNTSDLQNCNPSLLDPSGNPAVPFVGLSNVTVPSGSSGQVYYPQFLQNRFYCPQSLKVYLSPGNFNINVSSNCGASGNISIVKYDVVLDSDLNRFVYGGGVRLKRSYTLNENDDISNEKKYHYESFDDPNQTSGELFRKTPYIYQTYTNDVIQSVLADAKVVYKNVRVEHVGLGFEKHFYFTLNDSKFMAYNAVNNGLLDKIETYDINAQLKSTVKKYYEFKSNPFYTLDFNVEDDLYVYSSMFYSASSNVVQLNNLRSNYLSKEYTSSKSYLENGVVQERSITSFNSVNYQPAVQIMFNSNGEVVRKDNTYTVDLAPQGFINQLLNDNLVHQIVKSKDTKDGVALNEINYEFTSAHNFTLPHLVKSKKGTMQDQILQRILLFDAFKRPLTVSQENGTPVSFIYAYNDAYPVAKLEGIQYSQIPPELITNIRNATDVAENYNESNVLAALQALRTSTNTALKNAQITTYTYKPLVGISTVTDPKGLMQRYFYDNFSRLVEIRDHLNNIVSQQELKYKTLN